MERRRLGLHLIVYNRVSSNFGGKICLFNQITFTRFSGLSKIKIDVTLKNDLTNIFGQMKREYDNLLNLKCETFRLEIISALLKIILVSISGIIISQQNRDSETSCVINRFFLLLEKNIKLLKQLTNMQMCWQLHAII